MGNMQKNERVNGKKKKKHRVLKAIIKFILFIILLIALFIGSFVGYSIVVGNGATLKGLAQTAIGQTNEDIKNLEEFKVLILGISEDISVELTDTIMVASYNPKTQRASLLSIPRDTYIGTSQYSASSYDKINAVYQNGGAEATLEKVNEITGLDVKYYVVVSNNALVELVDEIGGEKGIWFDVPIDMNYDSKKQDLHIHLNKGEQWINGEKAECLLRFRKNNDGTTYPANYGSDDYGRMKTQRNFISAVLKQTLQAQNITKISNIIDIVKRNVKTNITNWDVIKDYIPSALEFKLSDLGTANIPGVSQRIPENTGLWFFIHDEEETKELIQELYEGKTESEEETPSDEGSESITTKEKSEINIEILNGSGDEALLTDVENSLKAQGFTVLKKETANNKISKTVITNRTEVDDDKISDIKSILGTGVISVGSDKSSDADITIILGEDYDG